MNANDVPRVAAPLLLAAAIVLSFPHEPAPRAIELPAGVAPAPTRAEARGALLEALSPASPGYDRGSTRAAVTVIEFADFGCRYCARFAEETYPSLADEFVKPGTVRWKVVPFVLGMFPNGDEAARAADCAGNQGAAAFGRMHDRLFARADEWKRASDPAALFRTYAVAVGLDANRFAACYAGQETDARIRAANSLADRLGVRATPTFFIDGARVEGALPAAQFRAVLLEALGGPHGN
jgi:protein-disulfide isomerase